MDLTMEEISLLTEASKKRNEIMYPQPKNGKSFKAPPKRQSIDEFADELGV